MEKLNILQISNRVPWPLNEGGTIGIYNYTKAFHSLGHKVTLYCLDGYKHNTPITEAKKELEKLATVLIHPIDTDLNFDDALKHLIKNKSYNVSRFYNRIFEQELIQLLTNQSFDIIQLEGTFVGPYIDTIRNNFNGLISVRMHNVEHEIWERLAKNTSNPLKKIYLNILAKQLKKYESNLIKKVDTIVTVTHEDASKFKKLYPKGKFKTIPAGINLHTWRYTPSSTYHQWYHIGSMEWHANVEAVNWFVKEIHPLLQNEDEAYCLTIAGKGLPSNSFENIPQLNTIQDVPDAYEFVKSLDVCIVPLKSGSGIRLKILEAMAAGKLVISTTIGAQGIEYINQKHLLIADTPQEFLSIFQNIKQGKIDYVEIIKEARKLIEKKYATEALAKEKLAYYSRIMV